MIFLALGVQLYTPARKSSAVTGTYIKMYEIMIKMFCAGGILLPRTCFEADFFFVFVSRRKDFGFGISAGMLLIELNKSRGRWLCALECEVNLAESARCVIEYILSQRCFHLSPRLHVTNATMVMIVIILVDLRLNTREFSGVRFL